MEETISLKELAATLKKRTKLIVLITILAALASGIVSYFVLTPIYQASTQVLVNQTKTEQQLYNQDNVQTSLQLISTYNVIMKSPAILEKVSNNLSVGLTAEQLSEKISVSSEQDSQVVNIRVEDQDHHRAAGIANETANVFQEEVIKIMNVDNVTILAPAEVKEGSAPVKPQPLLNIATAIVVGLMAGVGLAFLLEYMDNTIKSEQDIEKLLELPVLGSVTRIQDDTAIERKRTNLNQTVERSGTLGS
ncbi:YveK family protein [Domibacillus epiphyticus]|uniref:Capsular biosynthesis protein n=1 Tax=Domibacillus epiphyticus TaxID=1714355 RepID=A0A1V2A561_9BACI|nr:Wzz/FepE/Etk N-terminal domain-containing protein [Domibacillus epiphyticus]OMP66123.1 capsular biosynthesis protein [Domibacillus epiphyticus]